VTDPPELGRVWRVGLGSDPLGFVPAERRSNNNRFDDLLKRFGTLYGALLAETALREVLADRRPNAAAIARYITIHGPQAAADIPSAPGHARNDEPSTRRHPDDRRRRVRPFRDRGDPFYTATNHNPGAARADIGARTGQGRGGRRRRPAAPGRRLAGRSLSARVECRWEAAGLAVRVADCGPARRRIVETVSLRLASDVRYRAMTAVGAGRLLSELDQP
jgi:hypothetical protein